MTPAYHTMTAPPHSDPNWAAGLFLGLFAIWLLVFALPFMLSVFLVLCDRKDLVCTLRHSRKYWRKLSTVPVGFADFVDTYECRKCGDRWCRRS